jgi:hypothetical protein
MGAFWNVMIPETFGDVEDNTCTVPVVESVFPAVPRTSKFIVFSPSVS